MDDTRGASPCDTKTMRERKNTSYTDRLRPKRIRCIRYGNNSIQLDEFHCAWALELNHFTTFSKLSPILHWNLTDVVRHSKKKIHFQLAGQFDFERPRNVALEKRSRERAHSPGATVTPIEPLVRTTHLHAQSRNSLKLDHGGPTLA